MGGYHILPEEVFGGGIGTTPPPQPAYNFYIDRTSPHGALTPAMGMYTNVVFQKEYSIYAGNNCGTPSRVYDCSGISIAETPHSVPFGPAPDAGWYVINAYGLAGTCSKGCFFALLDDYGVPINQMLYPVPDPTKTISKPIIIKASTTTSGLKEFFICFRWDVFMIVLRVTETGTIVWHSVVYGAFATNGPLPGILEPTAMLESPYGPELIFAGKAIDQNSGLISGFIFTSSISGITSSSIRLFNINGTNPGWFSSMEVSNSPNGGPGFVLGGTSQPVNNSGQAWVLKVTNSSLPQFMNVVWSTLITPALDNAAGNIVGITERQNQLGNYEYYGVSNSQAGIITLKLDANGIPVSNGESAYNAGTSSFPSVANSLSWQETGPYIDCGLHIFGTDWGTAISGGGAHYLTQAYFNGYSGCNSQVSVQNYEQPSVGYIDSQNYFTTALTACEEFQLTYHDAVTYDPICGPFTSLTGGSNARSIATAINEQTLSAAADIAIYPNPSTGNSTISYVIEEESHVKIALHNALGQLVKNLSIANETAGEHEMHVDLSGLENGIYFVTVAVNNKLSTQKLVYTKP